MPSITKDQVNAYKQIFDWLQNDKLQVNISGHWHDTIDFDLGLSLENYRKKPSEPKYRLLWAVQYKTSGEKAIVHYDSLEAVLPLLKYFKILGCQLQVTNDKGVFVDVKGPIIKI